MSILSIYNHLKNQPLLKMFCLYVKLKMQKENIITYRGCKFNKPDTGLLELAYILYEVIDRNDYMFYMSDDCVFFDIGANVGVTSTYMANLDNIKKIYAFEPLKPTYARNLGNLSLNDNAQAKVELFNYGLSNKETEIEISYNTDQPGKLSTHNNRFSDVNMTKEIVALKSAHEILPDLINAHNDKKIVFKIDIEGSEYDLFENLNQHKIFDKVDLILMEWHKFMNSNNYPDQLIDMLHQNNFVIIPTEENPYMKFNNNQDYAGMIVACKVK